MRRSHLWTCVRVGASALALSAAGAAWAQDSGRATLVVGKAEAQRRADTRALTQGGEVFQGDRVSTGSQSRAVLKLGEATEVRLGENARLALDRFVMTAGGVLELGGGAMLLDKTPGTPETVIRSRYARIAVRGTRVFAGPSRKAFGVFVQRGEVVVTAAGTSVVLKAGQGTDIARPGAAPTPAASWGRARIDEALSSVQ